MLMTYPLSVMPFLAPFEAGIPGLIRDRGRGYKPAPFDKTMQTVFRKNTARPTADLILDILHSTFQDEFDTNELTEKLRPWEDMDVGSNGASWQFGSSGLEKVTA